MTESQSTTITATDFWEELQSLNGRRLKLVMPVGALVRSVPITSIQGHHHVVELHMASGEVLAFTASDASDIKRIREVQGDRNITRYELTFPLGDYFALISG